MNSSSVRQWVEDRRGEIIRLLSDMVAIDSVTGNEGPLAEFCAKWLREHGIQAILQPCKGRNNAISVVGEGERALILSGHLDTVPPNRGEWTYGPFTPTVADGRVYGLGTSDLHASTVGTYFASLFLRDYDLPGRYVTVNSIEEETTGHGTIGFLDWAEEGKFLDFSNTSCIVTEPTGLDQVCLGNRGSSFVVLRVEGLGGHGSRPHLARNPIGKVMQILDGLRELQQRWKEQYTDPDFGHTTLTPTALNAGDPGRTNVIPQIAEAVIDCRVTPRLYADDLAVFRGDLGALIDSFREEGYEIGWRELYAREGHRLDREHPLAQTVMSVLREDLDIPARFQVTPAGNDAVFYGRRGIPTINKLGPGHPECAHRVDEYVTTRNLLRGVELYIWIGLRHFGVG